MVPPTSMGNALIARTPSACAYQHAIDIGCISPDGYLQITDHIRYVIKCSGEWIASLEIEDMISGSRLEDHERELPLSTPGVGNSDNDGLADSLAFPTTDAVVSGVYMKVFVDDRTMSKFGIPERIHFV